MANRPAIPATDEEMEAVYSELRHIAEDIGHTPTLAEWKRYKRPGSVVGMDKIVAKVFLWSEAQVKAGLPKGARGGARTPLAPGGKKVAHHSVLCECGSGAMTKHYPEVVMFTAGGTEFKNHIGLCWDCYQLFRETEPA